MEKQLQFIYERNLTKVFPDLTILKVCILWWVVICEAAGTSVL